MSAADQLYCAAPALCAVLVLGAALPAFRAAVSGRDDVTFAMMIETPIAWVVAGLSFRLSKFAPSRAVENSHSEKN